jgi:hypothetical protein
MLSRSRLALKGRVGVKAPSGSRKNIAPLAP